MNFLEAKVTEKSRKIKKPELFVQVSMVDDTRLEFRGQSVNQCKSVPLCAILNVFGHF